MNRQDFAKLVVGGSAAILFAALVFGPLGAGLRYADGLERRVHDGLGRAGIEGVQVAIVREPDLERTILLSGDVAPETRTRALAFSQSVPGVASVRWEAKIGGSGSGMLLAPTARY